jgi:hypothetical protein
MLTQQFPNLDIDPLPSDACWAPASVAARIKTKKNLQIRIMLPPLESLLCDGDSRDWCTLDGVRFERIANQEVDYIRATTGDFWPINWAGQLLQARGSFHSSQ